jgi:hypothetical protein
VITPFTFLTEGKKKQSRKEEQRRKADRRNERSKA